MSSSEDSRTDNIFKDYLLPLKSKQKYIGSYECFMRWKNKRNEQNLNEDAFLAYFTELAKAQKPSSLWAQYSMLKGIMRERHHVLMQNYEKLLSFLKRNTVGFKSQQSEVLTEDNVLQFINEAPDEIYLATKVALIMGVGGACKCNELTDLTVNDIKTDGDLMLVQINSQHKNRMFIIREEFVPVVKKYQNLRPKKMPTNRFFVNYRAGKCTKQVIGRNKFSALPKQIATYLKLQNPERYTGHCFKRSAIASRTTSIIDRLRQAGSLETSVSLHREHSTVEAENKKYEIDVKVEEMDVFEEEPRLRNEFQLPMEYDKAVPTPLQSSVSDHHCGVSDNKDIRGDTPDVTDSVHIIEEEIETIDLTTLKENRQPVKDTQEANITFNGNNIQISFTNCRNITVNIH